jgi:hypothetical protein
MESNVRDKLAKALLKDLSSEENVRTRKQLQKARPQVLFLENLDFINDTIKELTEREHLDEDIALLEFSPEDLSKARKIAKVYQDGYIKRHKRYPNGASNIENTMGGRHLRDKFSSDFAKVENGTAFICSSFAQIGKCKKEIIDLFVSTSEHNIKKLRSSVDRGHGASDGLAVSGVQIAKGMGRAQNALGDDKDAKKLFQQEFKKYITGDSFKTGDLALTPAEVTDLLRVTVEYKQVVTDKGVLSATYLPFITFQDKYTNQATDRAREVVIKKVVESFFLKIGAEGLASMEGSSTIKQKMLSKAIAPLVFIDLKNKKVTVDAKIDPRKVKLKTKGKVSQGKKAKTKAKFNVTQAKSAGTVPKGKVKKATASNFSVAAIMGNLNAKLPDKVAQNMGSPALVYRTGRFASSVRATDVSTTPKGFPSIGYTYQRDPYEVFESTSGSRFSDAQRDPRVIIDKSIREIAAEMAIGRLFTRRI